MTGPQAYNPIARQIIAARHLKLVDSARLMASFAVALTDAYIAVFDAKYRYEFWRPITAIRNGDIDGNPATEIAGFHYRSSARVGTAMGREVGRYVATHFAQIEHDAAHPTR